MPAFVWSEEYQKELFSRHFKAFDILRRYGWFIGEFIWNFADFKTNQGISNRSETHQIVHSFDCIFSMY